MSQKEKDQRETFWVIVLLGSILLAFVAGVVLGSSTQGVILVVIAYIVFFTACLQIGPAS